MRKRIVIAVALLLVCTNAKAQEANADDIAEELAFNNAQIAMLAQDENDTYLDSLESVRSSSPKHVIASVAIPKKPMAEQYVDAEHAFYRAPMRKKIMTGTYQNVADKDDYYIVIEKSKYTLQVFNANDELLVTYPIALGNNDVSDKLCEGDRKTPEGTFHIQYKKLHSEWDKYLALDYPTKESIKKYNDRKAMGMIPAGAGVGGGIGLHGTRPKEDITIDRTDNWTYGCVSTKNDYIDELYSYIPVGTRVIIRR